MTQHDETMRAILRRLCFCPTAFRPEHIVRRHSGASALPRPEWRGRPISSEGATRRLRAAGYAEPCGLMRGYWRLTPSGMAAVERERNNG